MKLYLHTGRKDTMLPSLPLHNTTYMIP